ncbi:MAG: hypothetical protein L7W42_07795 [Alphaproteobacteria bacterium]|nr:hypothetical protein [Alphaproteobacteria bacterium]
MVYLKCLSHIWRRCVVAVFVVISAAVLSQASFAQYPGSAGDFSDSGLSASSSSSSATTDSAGSGSSDSGSGSSGSSSDSSSSGSSSGSGDQAGTATASDRGGDGSSRMLQTDGQVRVGTAQRKRALIKQFRLEFAKTVNIDTASQQRFQPLQADRYLDQFADEIADGLERPADLKSMGQDLAVMRDAIDDRLDRVITSYTGEKQPRRGLFAQSRPVAGRTPALLGEMQQLALKHELLQFAEHSLQAMGYYAK